MSLLVTCECGRRLRAKEHLRGRRVRCPRCRVAVTLSEPHDIPTDQPDDDFFESLGEWTEHEGRAAAIPDRVSSAANVQHPSAAALSEKNSRLLAADVAPAVWSSILQALVWLSLALLAVKSLMLAVLAVILGCWIVGLAELSVVGFGSFAGLLTWLFLIMTMVVLTGIVRFVNTVAEDYFAPTLCLLGGGIVSAVVVQIVGEVALSILLPVGAGGLFLVLLLGVAGVSRCAVIPWTSGLRLHVLTSSGLLVGALATATLAVARWTSTTETTIPPRVGLCLGAYLLGWVALLVFTLFLKSVARAFQGHRALHSVTSFQIYAVIVGTLLLLLLIPALTTSSRPATFAAAVLVGINAPRFARIVDETCACIRPRDRYH